MMMNSLHVLRLYAYPSDAPPTTTSALFTFLNANGKPL